MVLIYKIQAFLNKQIEIILKIINLLQISIKI
jgi:hypothetical protein